jgi:hypothetical protein
VLATNCRAASFRVKLPLSGPGVVLLESPYSGHPMYSFESASRGNSYVRQVERHISVWKAQETPAFAASSTFRAVPVEKVLVRSRSKSAGQLQAPPPVDETTEADSGDRTSESSDQHRSPRYMKPTATWQARTPRSAPAPADSGMS